MKSGQGRLLPIDAARGTAMLFVFLSHFAMVYVWRTGEIRLSVVLYDIAMIASPTFMLISGIMLGYLYRTHRDDFARIRMNYLNRGLFLLTIGRIIILGGHVLFAGGWNQVLLWGLATDAIGVSFIIEPFIISKLNISQRALLSVCIYVAGWLLVFLWLPESGTANIAKEFLVGPRGPDGTHALADAFPLLPWVCVHIVGNCIGEKMGAYIQQGNPSGARTLTLKVGMAGCIGGILIAALRFLVPADSMTDAGWTRHLLLSPFGKLPPSPAYTLFYGGIGALILYLLFRFENTQPVALYVKWAAVLGQTSLFVFMFQYYVYFTLLWSLNLGFTIFWPVYFIVTVAFIGIAAQIWKQRNYNRFLDVRYSNLVKWLVSAAW